MKFLVLGATGMVGHVIYLFLAEQGHSVVGFCRRPAPSLGKTISGDAFDFARVAQAINSEEPDVVVNCIGLLNRACDRHPDRAIYLNSYFPHKLESETQSTRTRIFHLSTDCVFAGNTGPYTEESFQDGRTMYDRSKALGELVNNKDLTLRQSVVGPDIDPKGIGLLNWFMAQTGAVEGYTTAIWTGLTTVELAKAVDQCARDGSTGLVNMVPEKSISKYHLLCLFNKRLRDCPIRIAPSEKLRLDKTLIRKNMKPTFQPAPYEQQVDELREWMASHCNLYPSYKLKECPA